MSKQVVTSPDPTSEEWIVQQDGKALSRHRTKEEAEREGREVARREQAEHIIKNRDGRIAERNSYGNDRPDRKG